MPPIVQKVPTQRPPAMASVQIRDFTGGLDFRDDAFQLSQFHSGEVSDIVDMDIQPQGGVQRRKTVRSATTATFGTDAPEMLAQYCANGVTQILLGNQVAGVDKIGYVTGLGGSPTAVSLSGATTTSPWRWAVAGRVGTASSERLYIQRNGAHVCIRWNGTTATDLTDTSGAFNDNLAAPAGGKAPSAKLICTHKSYLFHGWIVESGSVNHPNRIRWSHPGEVEDYRTNDYIDVGEGDDGDALTALASFDGDLYLFKDRSTWVLTGFDVNTFAVHKIADTGAVSQEAVSVSSYGLAAWDARLGLHLVHRTKGAISVARQIQPKLEDGTIPQTQISKTQVCWFGSRVYCSVVYGGGATVPNKTLIYDPFVGKGAWTGYGLGFYRFLEWTPTQAQNYQLGVEAGNPTYMHQLNAGSTTDRLDGSTEVGFSASVTTAWYDGGDPALKKRWRRLSLTFDNLSANDPLSVTAYKNWTYTGDSRSFTIRGNAGAGSSLVWDSGNWGQAAWGTDAPVTDQATVRGGSIGSAYAVSVRVQGPTTKSWGLNAVQLRFIPQRII